MIPWAARRAAEIAEWAAQPQWIRFTVPPVRFASITPPAMLTASPIAWTTPSASRPSSTAALAAAPIAPHIEVACWPRSK